MSFLTQKLILEENKPAPNLGACVGPLPKNDLDKNKPAVSRMKNPMA